MLLICRMVSGMTLTQADPGVLAALPEDVRQELKATLPRTSRVGRAQAAGRHTAEMRDELLAILAGKGQAPAKEAASSAAAAAVAASAAAQQQPQREEAADSFVQQDAHTVWGAISKALRALSSQAEEWQSAQAVSENPCNDLMQQDASQELAEELQRKFECLFKSVLEWATQTVRRDLEATQFVLLKLRDACGCQPSSELAALFHQTFHGMQQAVQASYGQCLNISRPLIQA